MARAADRRILMRPIGEAKRFPRPSMTLLSGLASMTLLTGESNVSSNALPIHTRTGFSEKRGGQRFSRRMVDFFVESHFITSCTLKSDPRQQGAAVLEASTDHKIACPIGVDV